MGYSSGTQNQGIRNETGNLKWQALHAWLKSSDNDVVVNQRIFPGGKSDMIRADIYEVFGADYR